MFESGQRFLFAFLPAGVAVVVGLVLAVQRRRANPDVAPFAIWGLGLQLVAILLGASINVVPSAVLGSGSSPQTAVTIAVVISLFVAAFTLVSWVLILTALFRRMPAGRDTAAAEAPTTVVPAAPFASGSGPRSGSGSGSGSDEPFADDAPTGRHALLDEHGQQVIAQEGVRLSPPRAAAAGATALGAAGVGGAVAASHDSGPVAAQGPAPHAEDLPTEAVPVIGHRPTTGPAEQGVDESAVGGVPTSADGTVTPRADPGPAGVDESAVGGAPVAPAAGRPRGAHSEDDADDDDAATPTTAGRDSADESASGSDTGSEDATELTPIARPTIHPAGPESAAVGGHAASAPETADESGEASKAAPPSKAAQPGESAPPSEAAQPGDGDRSGPDPSRGTPTTTGAGAAAATGSGSGPSPQPARGPAGSTDTAGGAASALCAPSSPAAPSSATPADTSAPSSPAPATSGGASGTSESSETSGPRPTPAAGPQSTSDAEPAAGAQPTSGAQHGSDAETASGARPTAGTHTASSPAAERAPTPSTAAPSTPASSTPASSTPASPTPASPTPASPTPASPTAAPGGGRPTAEGRHGTGTGSSVGSPSPAATPTGGSTPSPADGSRGGPVLASTPGAPLPTRTPRPAPSGPIPTSPSSDLFRPATDVPSGGAPSTGGTRSTDATHSTSGTHSTDGVGQPHTGGAVPGRPAESRSGRSPAPSAGWFDPVTDSAADDHGDTVDDPSGR